MQILDGKKLSQDIKDELKVEVNKMLENGERPPHLAAVIVGQNPASRVYVRNKIRFCDEVGYRSSLYELPEETTQEELIHLIGELNNDNGLRWFYRPVAASETYRRIRRHPGDRSS